MANYFIPEPGKVLLVDISHWQDDPTTTQTVDFAKMKSMNVSGVIMKAGQGLYLDKSFLVNWGAAKRASIPRGAYWYYDNRVEPTKQAQTMISSVVDISNGELGIWLDLEDRTEGVYKGWKNWYVFLSKIREAFPSIRLGIYTGHYYWVEFTQGSGIPKPSLDWFNQFPLWIASYGSSPLKTAPWDNYTIWQVTDLLEGELYGVESKELDGNYFNGTLEEYKNYFSIDGGTVPPIEEPSMSQYSMKVVSNGTRIRTDHNTYSTVVSSQPAGVLMTGSEIWTAPADGNEVKKGDIWMYVTHVNGVALSTKGWMAYTHKGVPICSDLKEIPVTPPSEPHITHVIEVFSDGKVRIDGSFI